MSFFRCKHVGKIKGQITDDYRKNEIIKDQYIFSINILV